MDSVVMNSGWAYLDGYRAFKDGREEKDNPYFSSPEESNLKTTWYDGFFDAKFDQKYGYGFFDEVGNESSKMYDQGGSGAVH